MILDAGTRTHLDRRDDPGGYSFRSNARGKRMVVIVVVAIAALVLILTGIGLIVFREPPRPSSPHPVEVSQNTFKIRTTSTGLVLIGIGSFLLIIAMGAQVVSK
jgi:hypothetical protein